MQLGIHVSDLTWPGGPAAIRSDLTNVARWADDAGFAKLSVMDHVFQIGVHGPPEREMVEAYTTLGFIAAHTTRVELLAWVTAATYREPGLLAKAVTTLDVLSGGRAWLGIGAGWNEEECRGLGLPFPPIAERFERLEEALQICLQMWKDSEESFAGKHYQLERTLNVPQSLTRPHPPILIGGGGEKKTLRLVAQYAKACNLFAGVDIDHKVAVLRQHCEDIGRDPAEIDVTVIGELDPGADGERVEELLEHMRDLADHGVSHYHGYIPDVYDGRRIAVLRERVIPAIASW